MPVPLVLADGRVVCAIEDNGLAKAAAPQKPFRPTIFLVDPGQVADATSPRRWPALEALPTATCNIAAPYLARLPGVQGVETTRFAPVEMSFGHRRERAEDSDARESEPPGEPALVAPGEVQHRAKRQRREERRAETHE